MKETFYCPFCNENISSALKTLGHLTGCLYCGKRVPCGPVPKMGDDDGWAETEKFHRPGCKWVETRGGRSPGK